MIASANGSEALAKLDENRLPCVILLDLMMPVLDGWEFLRQQRLNQRIAAIPVVVVSAAGDQAKSVEVEAYLQKPLELDLLTRTVAKYCKLRKCA